MPECRTVGELIKALQEYPENMPVVTCDHMGRHKNVTVGEHCWQITADVRPPNILLGAGKSLAVAHDYYDIKKTVTYTLKETEANGN